MAYADLLLDNQHTLYCKSLITTNLNVGTLDATNINFTDEISSTNGDISTVNGNITSTNGTVGCKFLDCSSSASISTLDFKSNSTVIAQPTGGGALISTSIVFYKVTSNIAIIFLPYATDNSGASINYINFGANTIPTNYRPSAETNVNVPIISNNVMLNGIMRLGADGSILIINPNGNFQASPAVNGFPRFCAMYIL